MAGFVKLLMIAFTAAMVENAIFNGIEPGGKHGT